jgi:protein-S-isoprenylcysteine O-methyltransferase Ste14
MSDRTSPDSIKIGKWLFQQRTSIPIPFALAILTLKVGESERSLALSVTGVLVTVIGELIRAWGVHHIGAISRTRSDRLGPLVASGPFALVRNPLYIGNIAMWVGFALTARLVWLAAVIAVLLALEYHAIVRWEESLLESRLENAYRDYAARVPRWIPKLTRGSSPASSAVTGFSWKETLFSERGTLIAIAVGYLLLWLKLKTWN